MDKNIIKIVLVDDHHFLRSGLKVILEDQKNMTVIGEAPDAKTALTLLKDINADIVIMDIELPGLNGIDATLEIKGLFPHVKVLILTMYDDEQLLLDTFQAGGSGYVLKDCPNDDLIKTINSIYKGELFLAPHKSALAKYAVNKLLIKDIKRDNYNILTKREKEILDLIAQGLKNNDIALKLKSSVRTLESHRSNIIKKLNLNNRFELVSYARRKKLIR